MSNLKLECAMDKYNNIQQDLKGYLIYKISQSLPTAVKIVPGSVPIVFFGNIEKAEIATLGLNPSNIEFVHNGKRRLVDRKVLNVSDNQTLTPEQAEQVYDSLLKYFKINPYKKWFDPMNNLFKYKGFEYYNDKIVHLDISPWATSKKWSDLNKYEKKLIIDTSIIKCVIKKQKIKKLFINGKTAFEEIKEVLNLENVEEEIFCFTTKNGIKRNFTIYKAKIWDCEVIGWNLYIHYCSPEELTKKINNYLKK